MMEYKIVRTKRRTVGLCVTKDLQVVVRAPLHYAAALIDVLVREHEDWILRQMEKIAQAKPKRVLAEEEIAYLKRAAKEYLPQRTAHFANAMGVQPSSVKITSAAARWGSCSGRDGICFSYRVMMLASELVDYIVVHELAHIRQKNHSAAFYREVAAVLPDYKERQRRIRAWERC